MKFFKKDSQNLTASERAEKNNEKLGKKILSRLSSLQRVESGMFLAHRFSFIYCMSLCLTGVETSYTHDAAWIGIFYGSWIAKKSAMKLFVKQLKAIEKTPALSEQFQAAMNKIRAKSGYKPFTPRDKTALDWVGVAALSGLVPQASYLYQIKTRENEVSEKTQKMGEQIISKHTDPKIKFKTNN